MFTKLFLHRALCVLTGVVGLVSSGVAAPPPNDSCAGAEVIPTAGPFPYTSAVVDVADATSTGDPPTPSCAAVSVLRSAWYRFTPNSTRLYTISCSGDTATTVQDSVMAIYTSSGGCGGPFTEVGCSDDEGDLQSAIARTLTLNVTYYVVVWMSSVSPPLTGKTFVQLRVTQPVQPTNDVCASAEIIPGTGPFPHLTSVADTTYATNSTGDPTPSCWSPRIRSVWYRFTPGVTATYELSLCTNTATTVYETVMAIYTSAGGCGSFTQVACNHTTPCGNTPRSTINATLTNGVTYYIVAWEGDTDPYIPGETSLQLRVFRFPFMLSGTVELQAFAGTNRMVRWVASAVSGGTTNYLQTNDVMLTFSNSMAGYSIQVPVNTTHVSAKTAWNLRRRRAVGGLFANGVATMNFTGAANLNGGDLVTVTGGTIADTDNAVTSLDYLLLLGNYLQAVGGNAAIGRADINGDGTISSSDYLLLLGNYLTTGDSQ